MPAVLIFLVVRVGTHFRTFASELLIPCWNVGGSSPKFDAEVKLLSLKHSLKTDSMSSEVVVWQDLQEINLEQSGEECMEGRQNVKPHRIVLGNIFSVLPN